jgi:phage/plasmid primase-like uncharacterized protein
MDDAHALISGREKEVLAALNISWPPAKGKKRICCPFIDHPDTDPSWRWSDVKRAWTCSCVDGWRSVFDAVMRKHACDFGSAVRWVKTEVLGLKLERSNAVRFTLPSATAWKQEQEQAEAERKAEAAERQAIGQGELARHLRQAWPCRKHQYLNAKCIKPHGALQNGHELIIPMQDAGGEIRDMQRIYIEDVEPGPRYKFTKKFIFGLEAAGLFYIIGGIPCDRLCFAEGFATAASIHEATGLTVVVCFSAGNIKPVAIQFREALQGTPFLFCADDDASGKGISSAKAAARAVGNAEIISPNWSADRGEKDTDFKDVAVRFGLEEVRRQLVGN